MNALSCNYFIPYTVDDSVDMGVGSGESRYSEIP